MKILNYELDKVGKREMKEISNYPRMKTKKLSPGYIENFSTSTYNIQQQAAFNWNALRCRVHSSSATFFWKKNILPFHPRNEELKAFGLEPNVESMPSLFGNYCTLNIVSCCQPQIFTKCIGCWLFFVCKTSKQQLHFDCADGNKNRMDKLFNS